MELQNHVVNNSMFMELHKYFKIKYFLRLDLLTELRLSGHDDSPCDWEIGSSVSIWCRDQGTRDGSSLHVYDIVCLDLLTTDSHINYLE